MTLRKAWLCEGPTHKAGCLLAKASKPSTDHWDLQRLSFNDFFPLRTPQGAESGEPWDSASSLFDLEPQNVPF